MGSAKPGSDSGEISRRLVLGLGAALALGPSVQAGAARPPNIIFIMADDLGYADLSSYGGRHPTPRIDSLAADGVRFTQAYANSCVCSPTRVGLITGRYQQRLRLGLEEPLGVNDVGLPPGTPTLPRQLKARGYRTALVGKWHIGQSPKFGPLQNGYDRFFGLEGGGSFYFGRPDSVGQYTLRDNGQPVTDHGYLTDEFGRRAVREIEEAARDGVPLFLSLHFSAPHWPWEGPEDRALSQAKTDIQDRAGGSVAKFHEMLDSLDQNVGRVLDALERLGLGDSIVVFTSDNGGERFSDTWPLIGIKGELLEGGIRVPILFRWRGRAPAGHTSQQVAMSMDWLPTFVAAAGGSPDPAAPPDGIDLGPALLGGPARDRTVFWRYRANDQAAVRRGSMKYLRISGKEYLFDLSKDERERAEFSKVNPEEMKALKAEYDRWNAMMLPNDPKAASYDVHGMTADRH